MKFSNILKHICKMMKARVDTWKTHGYVHLHAQNPYQIYTKTTTAVVDILSSMHLYYHLTQHNSMLLMENQMWKHYLYKLLNHHTTKICSCTCNTQESSILQDFKESSKFSVLILFPFSLRSYSFFSLFSSWKDATPQEAMPLKMRYIL